MSGVEPVGCNCPYCGEGIEILVDCSAGKQSYFEDCEVCCRPMTVRIVVDSSGVPCVAVSREDDP